MAEAKEKQEELPLEDTNEEQEVEVDLEESKESKSKEEKPQVEVESEEEPKQEATDDDSLDGYSKKVRDRIERMTYKLRESERREKAALDYAQSMQHQNKELQERSKSIDDSYIKEYDSRVSQEEEVLKKKLGDAIASGDVDEQVTINKDLARLAVEAERLNRAKVDREELEKKSSEQAPVQTPSGQPPKEVHPKAKAWAEKNSWFGSDEPMTLTAFSIHKQLVETEGYDPTSDSYYAQIDGRIREAFPHKFQESVKSTPSASPVASVSRASRGKSGKKVTLSKSEVAIAKKLGISLEQYAKQKQYLATR